MTSRYGDPLARCFASPEGHNQAQALLGQKCGSLSRAVAPSGLARADLLTALAAGALPTPVSRLGSRKATTSDRQGADDDRAVMALQMLESLGPRAARLIFAFFSPRAFGRCQCLLYLYPSHTFMIRCLFSPAAHIAVDSDSDQPSLVPSRPHMWSFAIHPGSLRQASGLDSPAEFVLARGRP